MTLKPNKPITSKKHEAEIQKYLLKDDPNGQTS